MKTILRLAVALSFAAMLSASAAVPAFASVEMVVVHVEGAPLQRGAVIDGSVPLKLEAGWTVTLVAADGSYVTLSGPSEAIPADANNSGGGDPKILEALRALLAAQEISTASLGVVRSGTASGDLQARPVAWAVDIERSGNHCIQAESAILWRQDDSADRQLKIMQAGGSRTATVRWVAGRDLLLLSSRSFADGETYVIEHAGRRAEVTVRIVPEKFSGPVQQAAWMADAGCDEQALALLDTIR